MPGVREVIEKRGIFCALYSDRASHFFVTPKAGGKVDENQVTQLGRALRELGTKMIPAYSPRAGAAGLLGPAPRRPGQAYDRAPRHQGPPHETGFKVAGLARARQPPGPDASNRPN
jgi:hypothetical protein